MKSTFTLLIIFISAIYYHALGQCCTENYNKGITSFNSAKYQAAKTFFEKAIECTDATTNPKCKDINTWIKKCNENIKAEAEKINKEAFNIKLEQANNALNSNEFGNAIRYYTEALCIDGTRKDTINPLITKCNDKIQEPIQFKKNVECYNERMMKGEDAFNKKEYLKAQQYFEEALKCNYPAGIEKANLWLKKFNEIISVTDVDGNVYKTVVIDKQVWMTENLRVTHFKNGEAVPTVQDGTQWSQLNSGAYCNYGNQESNASIYGRLYNWNAVVDSRGLCPNGWHVPTDDEWAILISSVSYPQGKSLKSKEAWNNPGKNTYNNSSGFSGGAGGIRDASGSFKYLHEFGKWWGSNNDSYEHSNLILNFDQDSFDHDNYDRRNGFSVRCLKD
jgi:uncharacterized protein (TIGR02145 family)